MALGSDWIGTIFISHHLAGTSDIGEEVDGGIQLSPKITHAKNRQKEGRRKETCKSTSVSFLQSNNQSLKQR